MLTNNVVNFEQLAPGFLTTMLYYLTSQETLTDVVVRGLTSTNLGAPSGSAENIECVLYDRIWHKLEMSNRARSGRPCCRDEGLGPKQLLRLV